MSTSTQAIVVAYDLPHAPAKVWRALTEPALVGGTRLELEHSGFLPMNAMAFAAIAKGWRGHLAERMSRALAEVA